MRCKKDIFFILSLALLAGLTACGNHKQEKAAHVQPPVSNQTPAVTQQFTVLLHDYYKLKDALVKTNSTRADQAAKAMQGSVRAILTALKPADTALSHVDSLQQQLDTLAYNLDKILAVEDKSCETKRIYFKPVSAALYDALKLIRLQHITIYHTFCPMAFREKGAFWLSDDPEIRNPYFGAKMIECGEVIDTLQ